MRQTRQGSGKWQTAAGAASIRRSAIRWSIWDSGGCRRRGNCFRQILGHQLHRAIFARSWVARSGGRILIVFNYYYYMVFQFLIYSIYFGNPGAGCEAARENSFRGWVESVLCLCVGTVTTVLRARGEAFGGRSLTRFESEANSMQQYSYSRAPTQTDWAARDVHAPPSRRESMGRRRESE